MTDKRNFDNDTKRLFQILIGLGIVYFGIVFFIHSIELVLNFISNRPEPGLLYLIWPFPGFPDYELVISISIILYGVFVVFKNHSIFKILVIFTAVATIYRFIILMLNTIPYNNYSYYTIKEVINVLGLLFLTFIFSLLHNYNWEKAIIDFGYIKFLILSILLIFARGTFMSIIN